MAKKTDYVELGLACADVCKALDRGMNGKQLEDLSPSVREAIAQLTVWVKPAMHDLDSSPTILLLRNGGGDPGEGRREGWTESTLPTRPCGE